MASPSSGQASAPLWDEDHAEAAHAAAESGARASRLDTIKSSSADRKRSMSMDELAGAVSSAAAAGPSRTAATPPLLRRTQTANASQAASRKSRKTAPPLPRPGASASESGGEQHFERYPEPYPVSGAAAAPVMAVMEVGMSNIPHSDPDALGACAQVEQGRGLRRRWNGAFQTGGERGLCAPQPQAAGSAGGAAAFQTSGGAPQPARQSTSEGLRWRNSPPYSCFGAAHEPGAPPPPPTAAPDDVIDSAHGVFRVTNASTGSAPHLEVPPAAAYWRDLKSLQALMNAGPVKTLAWRRLQLLEQRFRLHAMLNSDRELAEQKSVPHRDFYNVRKVDTHVHHSACMNQKHLLRFIKHKLKRSPNEVVALRDGRFMTLAEVFKSLHLSAYDLSIDTLDMHAHNTFHRFDRFNLKYNPAGQSRLRELFLKTDNLMSGQYLAEITREVMADLGASKYQLVEWRVSIYGRKLSEWDKLARWFYANRLAHANVRWLIQIPRLFFLYKKLGDVSNFQDMIDNIFVPLFEVSRDPLSNPPLHCFLQTVVGFDCVDDESKPELQDANYVQTTEPCDYDRPENPPYSYWMYYLWANITSLNKYRQMRGLSVFSFRPHAGEAGDSSHLASCFMLADAINHGLQLRKAVVLQYLYYLEQVGIAMSPLSNNRLFLDYMANPCPTYHARGLNVSLSTDDPLMLHMTKEPLVEEYCIAAQVWKFTATDLCELARNSVLQSDFEERFKRHFLGEAYMRGENDIRLTNVPDLRVRFRNAVLAGEREFLGQAARAHGRKK